MLKGIIAILLGAGIGFGLAYGFYVMDVASRPELFYDNEWQSSAMTGSEFPPRLEMESSFVDLGQLKTRKFSDGFVTLRNSGKTRLDYWLETDPPSGIELVDMEPGMRYHVEPGETVQVKVRGIPTVADEQFSKIFFMLFNDPNVPRRQINVSGQTSGGLVVESDQMAFSRANLVDNNVVELDVYSMEQDELNIVESILENNAGKDRFQVDWAKMSDEKLAQKDDAKSGATISITIDKELPKNVRMQKFRFLTDAEGFVPIELTLLIVK